MGKTLLHKFKRHPNHPHKTLRIGAWKGRIFFVKRRPTDICKERFSAARWSKFGARDFPGIGGAGGLSIYLLLNCLYTLIKTGLSKSTWRPKNWITSPGLTIWSLNIISWLNCIVSCNPARRCLELQLNL